MSGLEHLFERNRAWAARVKRADPGFFERLVHQQTPELLWIGCADSRVPANEILDLHPGEVFVHRNIANVVVHTDLNCLSVIQYAVEMLRVKHVIVCGHYGCGGIRAALEDQDHGLIDNWLRHVKDVHRFHEAALRDEVDPAARCDRLCELNVVEQVRNVAHTTIVKDAWQRGADLTIHGWVYSLRDGIISELCRRDPERGATA